jgi:hypothetical protein
VAEGSGSRNARRAFCPAPKLGDREERRRAQLVNVTMPAPDLAELKRCGLPKLGNGEDAGPIEALFHAPADAVNLLQFEAEQDIGQIVLRDDDQALRLLQVGADLTEKHVRREADGASQTLADLLSEGTFDLAGTGTVRSAGRCSNCVNALLTLSLLRLS